jgi:hypothetical protein
LVAILPILANNHLQELQHMQKGDKVIFRQASDDQVNWGNNDDPRNVLVLNGEYEVENIEVHSWHTKVYLKNIKGKFNIVHFEPPIHAGSHLQSIPAPVVEGVETKMYTEEQVRVMCAKSWQSSRYNTDHDHDFMYCWNSFLKGELPKAGAAWQSGQQQYTREQMKAAHTEGVLLAQQTEVFKKTDGRRPITRLEADAFIDSLTPAGQQGAGEKESWVKEIEQMADNDFAASEAIGFAEWLLKNHASHSGFGYWNLRHQNEHETVKLYEVYKAEEHKKMQANIELRRQGKTPPGAIF